MRRHQPWLVVVLIGAVAGAIFAAIPIHLFVSPANRLRCARASEVRDRDRAAVDQLLAE